MLLETLGSVTLKNFVSKSAVPAVNQRMEVYKWEVRYIAEKVVKSYIVGTETPDMWYLLPHGRFRNALFVYIQGFNGYLTTILYGAFYVARQNHLRPCSWAD